MGYVNGRAEVTVLLPCGSAPQRSDVGIPRFPPGGRSSSPALVGQGMGMFFPVLSIEADDTDDGRPGF